MSATEKDWFILPSTITPKAKERAHLPSTPKTRSQRICSLSVTTCNKFTKELCRQLVSDRYKDKESSTKLELSLMKKCLK